MNLKLNYKDGKPLYEQIFDQIAAQILKGDLAADECLPSIRLLAKELNVSVITAKNAYELLESKGYIYTRAGAGCFVLRRETQREDGFADKENKLRKEIEYYKALGATEREIVSLVESVFGGGE